MRVFVTGATGFIGRELVRQLVAANHDVLGLARNPARAAGIEQLGARSIVGDVRDAAIVRTGVRDADAVAHLALPRAGEGNLRASQDTYTRGTEVLLEACRGMSLRSFVLASGALGIYRHDPDAWIDETAPEAPSAAAMAARHAIDERVRRAHRDADLPAVILRPPIVYGRGGAFREFFLGLLRRGLFRVPGDGSYWLDFVHLEDCATAYRLAMERAPAGETLLVVDDEPVTMRAFADFLAREMGRRSPGRIPPFLAKLFAGRDAISAMMESVRLKNAKIKARLGWSPRFPTYRVGLPGVVREYRSSLR